MTSVEKLHAPAAISHPPSGAPDALIAMSARMGGDVRLVQGGGGNTSFKQGDVFWVKASGTWLAHAAMHDIFVRLPLGVVRGALLRDDAERAMAELAVPSGLRPSIETPLHALLPHAAVAHVHSVNAIAWAARIDAEGALSDALDGLAWVWVPYRRPGLPLTMAVRSALESASSPPDILLLGNHGLVVGGRDCDAAETNLRDVESRLSLLAREPDARDTEALLAANDLDWTVSDDPMLHAIATDPTTCEIAMRGVLYPDHIVFLGECGEAVDAMRPLSRMRFEVAAAGREPPNWALVPGRGLLHSPTLSNGAQAMLRCLAEVGLRCASADGLRYLDADEVAALTAWEAEAYRRARDSSAA